MGARNLSPALLQDMQENPIAYFVPRPHAVPFFYDQVGGPERKSVVFNIGGKRSSKSYSVAARLSIAITRIEPLALAGSLRALGHLRPPLAIRHWALDIRKAETVLLPIYQKLIPARMFEQSRGRNGYNVGTHTFYIINDEGDASFVEFMSYKMGPEAGESVSRHIVAFDECPKEEVYDSQKARIADVGGVFWGAMTIDEEVISWPTGWMDKRIMRGGDGKHVTYHMLSTDENIRMTAAEAPTAEQREAILQAHEEWKGSLSPEKYAVVIEGKPGWLSGRVYKQLDEDVHGGYMPGANVREGDEVVPASGAQLVAWLSRNEYGSVWCGMDYGHDHPTCCLWVFVAAVDIPALDIVKGDHIGFRDYKQRHFTTEKNIKAVQRINAALRVHPRAYFACRAFFNTDGEGHSLALRWRDAELKPFRRARGSIEAGTAAVERLFAPRPKVGHPQMRFVRGTCRDTIDDLLVLQWNPKWTLGQSEDRIIKKNDDLPEALRHLAFENLARRVVNERTAQEHPAPPQRTDPMTGIPLEYGLPMAG